MKCLHCEKEIHPREESAGSAQDRHGLQHVAIFSHCPACGQVMVSLMVTTTNGTVLRRFLIYPRSTGRPKAQPEVPAKYASDYNEACLVLGDSPKASAALSRRCLQHILRDHGRVKSSDLSSEIQEIIDSGKLPSHLVEGIDAIRHYGNFAAHPIKGKGSGEIVDIEPGEAEWSLELLEGLFDFYFIQPAILKKKRDALNKKLSESGKPPMK